jgi:VWFA-related protein
MRHRPVPGLALILAAIVQAVAPALGQVVDDPRRLVGEYAAIAQQYREGNPDAASRLLALGPLIVFTDGFDTVSWLSIRDVVAAAERADVAIHAVQTIPLPERADAELRRQLLEHPQLNEAFLLPVLARETGGTALSVLDTRDVRPAFLRIIDEFRSGYVLTYSPEGVPKKGWHAIEVRLKGTRGDVHARRGYSKP